MTEENASHNVSLCLRTELEFCACWRELPLVKPPILGNTVHTEWGASELQSSPVDRQLDPLRIKALK
jgi:hypothetical protein